MATKLIKRFKAPTPTKWRAGGNLWLLGCIALFGADQAGQVAHIIPIPERYAPYVQTSIVVMGILGKLLSGLAINKPKTGR